MIDLNWKIMLLATIDRAKYQAQIDQLINQLYQYETPQGGWPYPFDKKAKTGGLHLLQRSACLAPWRAAARKPMSTWPRGESHDGRATAGRQLGRRPCLPGLQHPLPRHAICRDGSLHPVPGHRPQAKNWDAGFPAPPTKLAKNNLPLLLSQLDQYWDPAPEPVLKQIREVLLKSDQPLAREAAARALGHMADPGSLPALMQALGDQTKMVQTSRRLRRPHDPLAPPGGCARPGRKLPDRCPRLVEPAHPLGSRARLQPALQRSDRR